MARAVLNVLALLLPIAAGVYQFYIKDFLVIVGYNRIVESIGNKNCHKAPELKACESKPFASYIPAFLPDSLYFNRNDSP